MVNINSGLQQIDSVVKQNQANFSEESLERQDWIASNNLASDYLSLGEVIDLLECFKQEIEENIIDYSTLILAIKIKKQRILSRWRSMLTMVHIKDFIFKSTYRLNMFNYKK